MSLIINALKKADKNSKKSGRLNTNFFNWGNRQSRAKRGVWAAVMIGLIVMIFIGTGFLAYIYFFNEDDSIDFGAKNINKPVVIDNIPADLTKSKDYCDLDEKININLGPDIEDEMRMDDLESFAISEKEPEEPVLPVRTVVSEVVDEFPEFVVSGVIWSPTEYFVYVNGLPYREHETVGDVVIEKITISSIIVTYKGSEYEIILQ
ncbi:hypothetical protein J7L67_03540 [bacterium]|nr:hypothetical protein [bacterium]